MNKYIATFHSHYGALTYCQALKNQGINARLAPVPRQVSSSCGTCVLYTNDNPIDLDELDELDGVFLDGKGGLECVIRK